jgi:predicted porin
LYGIVGGDVKAIGYTLAANYVMTLRTDLYVAYRKIDKENDNAGVDFGDSSPFAVGMRHTF